MSLSLGLRWSSRRIHSGQVRPTIRAHDARYVCYSLLDVNASDTNLAQFSHRSPISQSTRRPQLYSNQLNLSQQSRSLSLFGWGSNKASDDFSKAHADPTPSSQTIDSAAQASTTPSQPSIESIRTVKASHSTSDAPEPTNASNVEADALRTIENSVIHPENTTSTTGVVSDTPDLASVPEGLGYLKDVCGLDFGWGPTSVMQFILEHIHVSAGLSWSASIITMVFLLRAALFPLYLQASDTAARFQEIAPVIKELQAKSQAGLTNNDREAVQETQMQMREIRKESGVSFNKMFRPMFLQVPLGYGAWHILRQASTLPVPAFEAEHWLWLSNLAVADPWYIMPVATGALTWLNLNTTQKAQVGQAQLPGMALIKNVTPVIAGTFLAFQPGSAQIYFLANGLIQQLQLTTLQNRASRRILRLHPMPNQAPKAEADGQYSGMKMSSKVINTTARTTTTAAAATTPAPASTATKRSFMDKGVDSVKTMGQQAWQKASGSTTEKMEEKAKTRKREAQKTAAARYEAQRRQDLASMRSYRNAALSGRNSAPEDSSSSRGSNRR